MNALVTGGAGFIGSHLVDRLLKNGHYVISLDNYSTGRKANLDHHKGNPKLKAVEADISDFVAIEKHFQGVDWVFHIAALADIVPSIQNPASYHRSNVDGTLAVLEASRKHGVKRFQYAASSSCYGLAEIYPTPEIAPIRPQYPYALTKNLGEQMVLHWGQVYKLPVVSTRFFNVYGPRSRTSGTYGAVFGVFLAQKLKAKPFTVVGDGTQTRDFTFVTDVVDACVTAVQSEAVNEIFNVGSGKPTSVNRIVELLKGEVVNLPKRPGEPACTFADISKIRKMLGWEPKVSIEEGVAELLKNIDYWREAPVWTKDSIAEATKDWFKYLSPA
jgi:UDP-glucose 4-epimerase